MEMMDKYVSKILQKAESVYNAKTVNKNPLGNSANMIFELSTKDNPIILRISEYSEYKEKHINFELKWLKYLSEQIREVIDPILSGNGKLYEIVSIDGESYILCAFSKAPGRLVDQNNLDEWNETLFYKLGSIMGNIHKGSKQYILDKKVKLCFEWNEDFAFSTEFNLLDDDVLKIWDKIIFELEKLPKTVDSYGIIHNDLHQLNFFIDGDKVKVFDFDDCVCSWYSFDIALTLFQFVSTISYRETQARNIFAEKFIYSFLKGYKTQNSIESFWIDKFDLFLRYRRICTYKFIKTIFSKKAVNPHVEYLAWLREEIINDKPFVKINYQKLSEIL
ncbi:phosphotransferase enzyme family protein [Anaerosalibacter massiliensis]|uniref:Phosphotransferase n=1 Tax=Anaerosalibacter massiliensis TaxID=1347392 RepID=A0A9X2MHV8_9FIRM|nr:phosphotransferase [Anaerosalibacter massiliensis]MCR2043375.1 phosphotransferase [Anaerosalibacter massiliensis]